MNIQSIKLALEGFDFPLTTGSVGGSGTQGLDHKGGLEFPEALSCAKSPVTFTEVETPFGNVPKVKLMDIDGHPVVRIPMHGWRFPKPSLEQTMATFWILNKLGIVQVVANASVGGLRAVPWDVVIPDDVINNDPAKWVIPQLAYSMDRDPWVRMFKPFCSRIRDALTQAANRLKIEGTEEQTHSIGRVITGGTYITTPLGTFESAAEICKYLQNPDIVIVGQSSGQEAMAARILGICFAPINPVANYAEGINNGEWTPGGMQTFYKQCAIPMAVIEYWALQRLVNQTRTCQCQQIAESSDLSNFTN